MQHAALLSCHRDMIAPDAQCEMGLPAGIDDMDKFSHDDAVLRLVTVQPTRESGIGQGQRLVNFLLREVSPAKTPHMQAEMRESLDFHLAIYRRRPGYQRVTLMPPI